MRDPGETAGHMTKSQGTKGITFVPLDNRGGSAQPPAEGGPAAATPGLIQTRIHISQIGM